MSYSGYLLFGLALAAANVLGGLLVTSSASLARNARLLRFLIALGAGFMLAAIFVEVVPAAIELWSRERGFSPHAVLKATTLLLAGYLLIHLVEHTVAPHFHFGAETHPERLLRPTAAYAAIGGLSIHTFFDGVSIAAAFLVNFRVGLLVFIAVLLHKVPEGFTAASIMLASGRARYKAQRATLLIGAATLLGVMSVAIAQAHISALVAYALPFSAGVTLYVAASDLIPEVNHMEEKNPLTSVVVFVGVALFYLLHALIGEG